jgi:integrase/recombinase XerD
MTALAPHLSAFLREHLPQQRGASIHTCDAYAYGFQLLVSFAAQGLRTQPSSLTLEQLDSTLIIAFLKHLEHSRGNGVTTRNARLAAIKSFFRFVEYRVPACLEQAGRIRAIPQKRTDVSLVDYLNGDELHALLDAPNLTMTGGIRDRAMLYLTFAAGLRVSELVALQLEHLQLAPDPTITVHGKGRTERVLPLWKETLTVLRAWLAVRPRSHSPELFLNARGEGMTRSGFEYILTKHLKQAVKRQPSLAAKRVSPHVLRHTCAMHTLKAMRDIRKVALWLGHASVQSTEVYLRADPTEKLEALSAMLPPSVSKGRFRVPDKLLAMLAPKK